MILDLPSVRGEQFVTTQLIQDATPPRGNPLQFARLVAEQWRDLEAREFLDAIAAYIRAAAQFAADGSAGEPTWEDAAWQ